MNDDALGELFRETVVRARTDEEACPTPEALRTVVEHALGQEERLAVLAHVAGCSDCQADLALLGQVAGARPAARRSLVPMGWLAAAAVVALAFLGGRALVTRTTAPPVMRGGEATVTLVQPSGSVTAEPAPRFVWRSVERAHRYEVEVLGPDAAAVALTTVRDTAMAAPDGLVAGVHYRWRVTALRADGTRVESRLVGFDLVHE